MSWLVENWVLIVVMVAVIASVISFLFTFKKLPTNKQLEAVKSWLLYWVLKAEASLGGGTGKIKLAMVYDAFVQRYPWLAKIITYNTFSLLVDEALDTMREMLQSNPNLLENIKDPETVINNN